MPSPPLHLILLCAVVYSQIFGGFSCCCLSRSIVAGFPSLNRDALPNPLQLATENKPATPKCPRCAASQTPSSQSNVAKNGFQGCSGAGDSFAGDSECRCTKASAIATVQTEPRSTSISVHCVVTLVAGSEILPFEKRKIVRRHEVPLRLGSHSWQSMACIWKK